MFSESVILSLCQESETVPHSVLIRGPYDFRLRPLGFGAGERGYTIEVTRVALRMRASVRTEPIAVALRTVVTAGATAQPLRLEQLRDAVEAEHWQLEINLSDGDFTIQARSRPGLSGDDLELCSRSVRVALALSDFVLEQLIVIRSSRDMRPATYRSTEFPEPDGETWEYDPSERDRSTRAHRALENWLMDGVRSAGLEPMDPVREPFFDLAWKTGVGDLVVCEVKSTSEASEEKQLRLGVGQVLHYVHQLRAFRGEERIRPALLIQREPTDPIWVQLTNDLGIALFWPEEGNELPAELL